MEGVSVEPTAEFAQLQLGFVDQTQWRYEVIRPLVLFGFPVVMEKFWAVKPLEHECGMGYVSSIYAANGLIRRCLSR